MALADYVRVGVVGTSAHVARMHLAPLSSYCRAKVMAVCGRNPRRAADVAATFDIPKVFSDYREMIEKGDLDAIVIASPDDLHYSMTLDALDAGLHVLCEKPLALNRRQAMEMYRRAEETGRKHMTFFSWRWLPRSRHLRHLVRAGYLGRLFDAELHFRHGFGRSPAYDWRYDRARANGALADLGTHLVDLALWTVGDIVRVSGRTSRFVQRRLTDDTHLDPANDAAQLLVDFANGAQGSLDVSAVTEVADREIELGIALHGSEGSLEWTYTARGSTLRAARAGAPRFEEVPIPDELWGDADRSDPFDVFHHLSVGDRSFVDAILDDRPVNPSFAEGLRAQRIIDAAIEADRTRRWVELSGALT